MPSLASSALYATFIDVLVMLNLLPGTIVTRQRRGLRTQDLYARILSSFTRKDALGRDTHHYQVELLAVQRSGLKANRDWPASHTVPVGPPPTTEVYSDHG